MDGTSKINKSPSCLISIDQTMNNNSSTKSIDTDVTDDQQVVPVNARKSKRLGRGAVTTGLTCECGIFAAMATEWSAHKVSLLIENFNSFRTLIDVIKGWRIE